MRVEANGVTLDVLREGDPRAPQVLLIMGLGMGLYGWPDELVGALVKAGYGVVRFDNRDCGQSTVLSTPPPPVLPAMMRSAFGLPVSAPYDLDDMAADTAALLDALGIERAHVVGASMGGMIAQQLAVRVPRAVASLVSIMSSSGARRLPLPRTDALLALLRRPAPGTPVPQLVEHYVQLFRVIGSPGFETPEDRLRERLARGLARGVHPDGTARQLLAVMASGDRSWSLAKIAAPTLVIHGRQDPLIPFAHGEDTAAKVPGARLVAIDGMGHDFAPGAVAAMLGAILGHLRAHPV